MEEQLVRLSKIMSERGMCSRREADRFIEMGQVLVNGQIISTLGTKVALDADIEFVSSAQKEKQSKVTILLNKPIGYVSTQPEKGYIPAIELITEENQIKSFKDRSTFNSSHLKKLAVAGRLDIDSKGLLVFTQDGVIAKQLIGCDANMEKEYLVRINGTITDHLIKRLSHGLFLDDKPLKPAKIDQLHPNLLRFILKEGKKRQIRRMCEIVDLEVVGLKRVRIGNICLGDLPDGKWRYLRSDEQF